MEDFKDRLRRLDDGGTRHSWIFLLRYLQLQIEDGQKIDEQQMMKAIDHAISSAEDLGYLRK